MKKLLILAVALLVSAGAADAKWWIFGKSKADVGLKYLYINKIPTDETGPKLKLFREMLPSDGLVRITGRPSGTQTGAIRITLDDKGTWQDVKFADNGAFEYSFKPEAGKTYTMLIEVTDTAGKTNNVEDTRKEITLSDENIQAKVRETLDGMFDAYNKEDLQKFMGYVGENFAADKDILERAVKRDFDALSSINIRYTVNNIASGAQGRVFVSVTYNRMVFVNKTGASSSDTGSTEFVFDSKEGKLSLFSMKQPLMFGLSDAENVATGEVLGNTGNNLTIDETGSLGGGTLVTVTCPNSNFPAYNFPNAADSCGPGGGANIWFYDNSMPANVIGMSVNAKAFNKTLSSLTAAEVRNTAGYAGGALADSGAGYSYCFDVSSEFYCLELVSGRPTTSNETVTFRTKKF
jgi:hypothetical protein